MSSIQATTVALSFALMEAAAIAKEQNAPAFVTAVEDGSEYTYRVSEMAFDPEGIALCRIYPNGRVEWPAT